MEKELTAKVYPIKVDKSKTEQNREYCIDCDEVLFKEPSIYFPKRVNVLCYKCRKIFASFEYENDEEAKEMCAEYWKLMFKIKPVTTAQTKTKTRRKKKVVEILSDNE